MKILVVDDDPVAASLARTMVHRLGHECLIAGRRQAAWELVGNEHPEMVITDRVMPDVDGLELCRKIREANTGHRYVYIVMVSGQGADEQALEGMLVGADDYLSKPLRPKQIQLKTIAAERVTRLHRELADAHVEVERRVRERTAELEASTRELSSFAYSVSHDLRAPLRSLHGFSQILMDSYAERLDETGVSHLRRLQVNATRMGDIIDALLTLSRTTRAELNRADVDLEPLARSVHADLMSQNPDREIVLQIDGDLRANGDARLIRITLENLMANAVKFSAGRSRCEITVGLTCRTPEPTFFVDDNGVGFDPAFADKLFEPFQRLHSTTEFDGNGIGLAIAHRVIARHGGRIWGESPTEAGATFYFTTAPASQAGPGA